MQGPCAAAPAAAACQSYLLPVAPGRCSWQRIGTASNPRCSVSPRLVRACAIYGTPLDLAADPQYSMQPTDRHPAWHAVAIAQHPPPLDSCHSDLRLVLLPLQAPCCASARRSGGTLYNAGSCSSSTSSSSCSPSTRCSPAASSAGLCSTSSSTSASSWRGHRHLWQPCPHAPPAGSSSSRSSSPQLGRVCAAAIAMPWQQAWNPG
jgi:hypothetical protein